PPTRPAAALGSAVYNSSASEGKPERDSLTRETSMKSHSTFSGRQIGRHVLASLSVIVALAASVSAQSVLGTTGNPLAGGTAAVAGTGSPAPNATASNWKTYKHPVGLSLRYPGDWTLQEGPGFIHLISPE